MGCDWVHLVRRPLLGPLYQPQMIDDDEHGAVGGMRIGRRNRSTWRKATPAPLCPPQIPHNLTWARTWAAAVGSRRLTTWAMARPITYLTTLSETATLYMASNDRITVNNQLQKCTRKLNLRHYPEMSLERLRKPRQPAVNIVWVPAESEVGQVPK
jgi:hypothetical protein